MDYKPYKPCTISGLLGNCTEKKAALGNQVVVPPILSLDRQHQSITSTSKLQNQQEFKRFLAYGMGLEGIDPLSESSVNKTKMDDYEYQD